MREDYDRVEWDSVESMLCKMGFPQQYVQLLLKCLRTIKYHIKVNGEYTEEIIPRRGLRQGDPLLFLICVEGFSSLLHQVEVNNSIQGIKVCAEALSITHLLFADDSLILLKANENNARCLQQILHIYEACLGQKINKEKSAIMFSLNTRPDVRERVKQVLQLTSETHNEKYPGLPAHVGQSK
jgi:hypothetical protein